MTRYAYLTFDDSPSTRMDDLVDYCLEKNIPALFFCRGDFLEENPVPAVRAVQNGFLIGNHSYSHTRADNLSYEDIIEEIEKTEKIIDGVYSTAGEERPGKYFRFPHLDRGCGGWILDFDVFNNMEDSKAAKISLTEGLNVISFNKPSPEKLEKKEKIQAYLKEQQFEVPFKDVTHGWYQNKEVSGSHDCLFTYSTCDWMATKRHEGRWRYGSAEELKQKIDLDNGLQQPDGVNVILAHDQAEIIDVTIELIDYMLYQDIRFLPFQ